MRPAASSVRRKYRNARASPGAVLHRGHAGRACSASSKLMRSTAFGRKRSISLARLLPWRMCFVNSCPHICPSDRETARSLISIFGRLAWRSNSKRQPGSMNRALNSAEPKLSPLGQWME